MHDRGNPAVPAAAAEHGVRLSTESDHNDASPAARVLLMPGRELLLAKDPGRLRALARFTCWRCRWVMRSRVRRLLHVLQCPGAPEEQCAGAVWALAFDLSFIPTMWPKGTRLASRLAGAAARIARRFGYESVEAWLRDRVYRLSFQDAITTIRIPTRHRRAKKWLRDTSDHVAEVAPVDLPPEWFEWWVKKETQRRADPMLRELFGVRMPAPRPGKRRAAEKILDLTSADGAERPEIQGGEDVPATRRELYRLCDPEAAKRLSVLQQRLLQCDREGYSTAEIRAELQMPTNQAVFAARHRLLKKLEESARQALGPTRRLPARIA